MIRELASALIDVVQTLSNDGKKYGSSTKQELEMKGVESGERLSTLTVQGSYSMIVSSFCDVQALLRSKAVPRFGEIVVGSSMYKKLRSLDFDHKRAQAAVDMWDHHTQG